jgi:hypothetical protein
MGLFRKKAYQLFRENPPCERCDEVGTRQFRGEAHPLDFIGGPATVPQRGYWDQFDDLYPRPLWLCSTCRVSLVFWFNRREFVREFPRGKRLLQDAGSSLSELRDGPLQLVGTPARIFEPPDVLAVGMVAERDLDLGSRICTRRSFAENKMRIMRITEWIKIWEADNPVQPV